MRLALVALAVSALPLHGAYTYWFTDYWNTINTAQWQTNGPVTSSADGFYSNSTPDGTAILKTGIPDGTSDYEVRAKLNLTANGGSYFLFLRATQNAQAIPNGTPVGSFIGIEVKDPVFSNGTCSATLNAWRGSGGTLSPVAGSAIACANGMEVRAVAAANNIIRVYLNEVLYFAWQENVVTSGKPGIGGFNMPAGNGISRVDLGSLDRTAPTALPQSAMATAVFDQRVEFQWTPAADGPNGIGIQGYHLFRDGAYLNFRRNGELLDLSVTPGTTYTYGFQAEDFHGNQAGITYISVNTPAAGNTDPRQIGVRPLGTYWGGLGEQIDLQSGNVNYSMPLFKAQSRGGWGVTFALSYNSQNWRRDTAGTARTWNHGRDIGYGYGWRFLAGALTPLYTSYWNIGMYRFMDSTGAEYRLRETSPGSGEWVAKDCGGPRKLDMRLGIA